MQLQDSTQQIAGIYGSYDYDSIPTQVRDFAVLAVLDNLGCALRGSAETMTTILASELFEQDVSARDLLPGGRLQDRNPRDRARLHAVAAHAIDYDDTFLPAYGAHVGSAVVGAAWAQATTSGASGRELITAVVTGYEVAARIGSLLQMDHYLKGFHPTSTVGTFASAAASAKLLGLSPEQYQAAMGLAATQACGLKCTFGTMAKPFNAGQAAAGGLLAARLVKAGFTAPDNALEAEKGYLDLFLGLPRNEREEADATGFRILENAFKFHAACHATHCVIEAIEELRQRKDFDPAEVEELQLSAPTISLKTASVGIPKTGLECKFSFTQVAASALLGLDTAADETFSDDVLLNPQLNAARDKIVVVEEPDLHPFRTRLKVSLRDGTVLAHEYDLQDSLKGVEKISTKLQTKFLANASPCIGDDQAQSLLSLLLDLQDQDNIGDAVCALLSE